MEEVVDNVVKKFEETEKSLQAIEDRLESNFAKQLAEHSTTQEPVADKASLLQELTEVKEDYAQIKKEACELGKLQREMALAFQQQLLSTVQKLQALADKGVTSKESDEATTAAVQSLVEQSKVAETLTNKLKSADQT